MVWEKDIPFTKMWIEIEVKQKWFEFQIREIYTPSPEAQRVLGQTDSRTVFELGFSLRQQSMNEVLVDFINDLIDKSSGKSDRS